MMTEFSHLGNLDRIMLQVHKYLSGLSSHETFQISEKEILMVGGEK